MCSSFSTVISVLCRSRFGVCHAMLLFRKWRVDFDTACGIVGSVIPQGTDGLCGGMFVSLNEPSDLSVAYVGTLADPQLRDKAVVCNGRHEIRFAVSQNLETDCSLFKVATFASILLEEVPFSLQHTMKLLVSTSLRAYNLYSPVVDESNPRGQIVVDLLAALFSGEEYLALSFFDSPLDGPIKELAEALSLFFPARSRRFLQLLTSLCQGPWATENVFNFLYHQRTVAFPYPHAGGEVQARLPVPLPHAPGLFVPPGAAGALLGPDDVIDDVGRRAQLVAWECRHHPVLVLLLMARELSERIGRGESGEEVAKLRSILELLAALVSAGGSPVATLVLELDSSPLVIAGKRDGRVDPALQLDTVETLAAIAHHLGHARGVGVGLLPAVLTVLTSFVEICPARVGANVAQVGLFEVGGEGGRMERLQEVMEGGEYRTGDVRLTLAGMSGCRECTRVPFCRFPSLLAALFEKNGAQSGLPGQKSGFAFL